MSRAAYGSAWRRAFRAAPAGDHADHKPVIRRGEPEHDEQAALIEIVELHRQRVPELWMLFAAPNGGKRPRGAAGKLKAEGTQRGVQDLWLPVRRAPHVGLVIEMKAEGGRLSQDQKEWRDLMRWQGWRAEVCWGCKEAWAVLCEYLEIKGAAQL